MAGPTVFSSSICSCLRRAPGAFCSKKILLLLVWQTLFSYSLGLLVDDGYLSIFLFRSRFLWLCLAPLVCWLDFSFGRHKFVILFGPLVLLFVSFFYMAAERNVSELFNFLLPGAALVGSFSVACYAVAMLPFVMDQLCGATSDELSTLVRWYYWADNFGYGLSNLFKSEYMQEQASSCSERMILFTIVPVVIIISECLCQWWSDNPVNIFIMQILHYAKKHRCLERHSSYNDEEQHAQTNEPKSSFKFAKEEVEDVKIVLRLVPLLTCLNVFLITVGVSASTAFKLSDASDTFWNLRLGTWPYALLLIPFIQLLFSPCVSKCSKSIVRYINTGVLVCIVGFMLIFVTGAYRLVIAKHINAYKYLFCDAIVTSLWPVNYAEWYWRLCPSFIWGIGKTIAYIVILEFIIAQSPDNMKGLVFGIMLGCRAIISLVLAIAMQFNFTLCHDFSLSLVLVVVIFVIFLAFPSAVYYLRGKRDQCMEHDRGTTHDYKKVLP